MVESDPDRLLLGRRIVANGSNRLLPPCLSRSTPADIFKPSKRGMASLLSDTNHDGVRPSQKVRRQTTSVPRLRNFEWVNSRRSI